MAAQIQAPKGVPEYFPPRGRAFEAVRAALSAPAEHAGYGYVELPVFEDTALYVRGVGESTDVVSKEMYTFEDRAGRSLSLRPEGTAGVMRLVVEHGLDRGQLPVKLWYAGPFFRAERPQHGRYRHGNARSGHHQGLADRPGDALDGQAFGAGHAGQRVMDPPDRAEQADEGRHGADGGQHHLPGTQPVHAGLQGVAQAARQP